MRGSNHPDYVPRGGRKTQVQSALLISHLHLYKGSWEDKKFNHLVKATGFKKRQINKWFWDHKKKENDLIAAKKILYPGLIFTIMDTRNGRDLTPNFKKLFHKKAIFTIEKVKRDLEKTQDV